MPSSTAPSSPSAMLHVNPAASSSSAISAPSRPKATTALWHASAAAMRANPSAPPSRRLPCPPSSTTAGCSRLLMPTNAASTLVALESLIQVTPRREPTTCMRCGSPTSAPSPACSSAAPTPGRRSAATSAAATAALTRLCAPGQRSGRRSRCSSSTPGSCTTASIPYTATPGTRPISAYASASLAFIACRWQSSSPAGSSAAAPGVMCLNTLHLAAA
mmetsp:Transcript_18375/g.47059  ORF Transcript_18375/g.47059 Transcript_18375/m.47059 type:complete len:218 (-) Transcript_18375:213-866(-)